ncbi:MAG: glutamate-1-semialdehyde-2,1-aminomutase [Deltaproteobacteria bacterium]|nr:glutamate-1-semialdehyde-2,1-aminomutase [Deltaproteobacteria bacterium]
MKTAKSRRLFAEAQKVIPGGVNSPVRAFRAVGLDPLFVAKAKGSKIYDADGRAYIDYVSSWGPMILGHAHPRVRKAMARALSNGWSYGAATELEVRLARMISKAIPSMELVRMVSSGTEATMSALRVARGFTGRNKVLKFAGCYHGHADSFLVKAGSGAITFGVPDSAGVPESLAAHTLTVPYNDLVAVQDMFDQNPSQISCVIVEPVAGNMGVVLPREGFLKGLEVICRKNGSLLIFDEVITGFRLTYGGVQKIFGIQPDLTCLGKIIGGGMPVGAYGGRREIMEKVSPLGPVYQAGTLSGNPLAMTCGLTTLEVLQEKGAYKKIDALAQELCRDLEGLCSRKGIPVRINRCGSMFTIFFTSDEVYDYSSAKKSDAGKYAKFFQKILEAGVWFPPSQFEACFISLAHTKNDLKRTLEAVATALEKLEAE